MRKLILKMQCSLDGFVAGPHGEIDWALHNFDAEFATRETERLWHAGAHLMGTVTYSDMAAYWPVSTETYAPPMNNIPKIVFSHSLKTASWGETQIVDGDLSEEITRLKEEPGFDLLAHGGARFAHSLIRSGLVDEYWLNMHPVALGRGLRLFPELPEPVTLKLVDENRYRTGVVAAVYQAA